MKMKLIKRCIVVLMAMIFVMPCCKAGEEVDRLKEAYERKFSKPITQQLEELDGLAQQAILAGRPLVIAFGTSRMEKDNLILTKYENPFMVWILHYMMYMPKNKEEFSHEYMVTRLRETYEKDMASDQTGVSKKNYDELSYDEKVDYCISIISDPSLIAGDILNPELCAGLSSRYAGRVDLITTDIGVTEKFEFTYDALSHYTRLLKSNGVMAFDFSHSTKFFEEAVWRTYLDMKGIKGTDENSEALEKQGKESRKAFEFKDSIPSFMEKFLDGKKRKYLERHKNMKTLPAKLSFYKPDFLWQSFCVLDEDTQEYKLVISDIRAQNFSDVYEREMNDSHRTLVDSFFSQEIFADYSVEMQCGFFPYVVRERHHTENLDYVVIRRK